MAASPRIPSLLRYLAVAAAAAIAAGCAGTPQPASAPASSSATAAPSTAANAESPASASKLVRTADFATQAAQDGWHPHVQDGEIIYCKTEMPINSRLPERTCLSKEGVEQTMLAEEHQREAMQRPAANAGSSGN
jgi:hypothetical protein